MPNVTSSGSPKRLAPRRGVTNDASALSGGGARRRYTARLPAPPGPLPAIAGFARIGEQDPPVLRVAAQTGQTGAINAPTHERHRGLGAGWMDIFFRFRHAGRGSSDGR